MKVPCNSMRGASVERSMRILREPLRNSEEVA
jgi:hypothetical protein